VTLAELIQAVMNSREASGKNLGSIYDAVICMSDGIEVTDVQVTTEHPTLEGHHYIFLTDGARLKRRRPPFASSAPNRLRSQ